jgi:hypothetical protein
MGGVDFMLRQLYRPLVGLAGDARRGGNGEARRALMPILSLIITVLLILVLLRLLGVV